MPIQPLILAQAANAADLMAARTQMAISLGWHIVIACFGVGFPLLAVFCEWRGVRTGDKVWGLPEPVAEAVVQLLGVSERVRAAASSMEAVDSS